MLLIGKNPYPYRLKVSGEQLDNQREFIKSQIRLLPRRVSSLLIDQYAEAKRVYPPGSRMPGPYKCSWTPYFIETMRFMSPSSPIQRDISMKGVQIGATSMVENILCYYMDEYPADILFMSATEKMIERWASRRLEPAIDSFGFRNKLVFDTGAGLEATKSKRSGDKMFSKDYFGGRLDMTTHNSPAGMSATDKRVLVRDEPDRAKSPDLPTGEGKFMDVSYARTDSWGPLRKVVDISTPTTWEKSEIFRAYREGDQRKYMVPCPLCGAYQVLEKGTDKSVHGLKAEFTRGQITGAYYVCDHCHDGFRESYKFDMINAGYWEPTTTPLNRFWRSRHVPAYYSLMKSWEEICFDYELAKTTPGGMAKFTQLVDGMPSREVGVRLSEIKLQSLKGAYHWKTIPEGVLFTTVAVDVQRGTLDDPKNPPRLEMEVCGHGHGYRTWSIFYKRFEGPVEDPYAGAWEDMYQFIAEGGLRFPRRSGAEVKPKRIFLDSGWAPHAVYRFAERVKGAYAIKGQGNNYEPDEKAKKDKKKYAKLFKAGKGADGTSIIIISSNDYKRIMQAALRVKPVIDGPPPAMLCQFPEEYGRKEEEYSDVARYFEMLTADELLEDGSFTSGGRRNEASSCRIYNLCAADSWIYECVEEIQENYRKRGVSEAEVRKVTRDIFLTKLEREIMRGN